MALAIWKTLICSYCSRITITLHYVLAQCSGVVFLSARSSSTNKDDDKKYGPLLGYIGGAETFKSFEYYFESKKEYKPWFQVRERLKFTRHISRILGKNLRPFFSRKNLFTPYVFRVKCPPPNFFRKKARPPPPVDGPGTSGTP